VFSFSDSSQRITAEMCADGKFFINPSNHRHSKI
jgi:hypothetical protein